jgi:hypothetical protein
MLCGLMVVNIVSFDCMCVIVGVQSKGGRLKYCLDADVSTTKQPIHHMAFKARTLTMESGYRHTRHSEKYAMQSCVPIVQHRHYNTR